MRVCLIMFLLFVSCSTSTKRKERPLVADAKLNQFYLAAKRDLAKNSAKAVRDLDKIINEFPNSELAVPSAQLLGDYYLDKNNTTLALDYYLFVIENDFYTRHEVDAVSRSIQIYNLKNDKSSTLELLNKLLSNSDLPLENRKSYLGMKLNQSEGFLSSFEQLKLMAELYHITELPNEKTNIYLKALNLVEGRIVEQDFSKIIDDSSLTFVHAPIAFRMATVAFENSDFSVARTYLNKVIALQPDSDIAERSQEMIHQISAREIVNPNAVGVVLPLSGKYELLGKSVLYSIQYAFDFYSNKSSPIQLSVVDSEDKAVLAQKGVEKLVSEDHVIGIIGSMLSKTASAVATRSQSFGVPTIVLSQKSDLTEIGDFVFRNALTGKMQVRHLVETAMETKGFTTFGILYPNDSYGIEYANLFWDEVVSKGGKITAAQTYDPTETDFRKPIQRLIGRFYLEDREVEYSAHLKSWYQKNGRASRKKVPDDLIPPIVNFEALFIPDSARALGQISAMLAYNDVSNLLFLGTNLWNTPTLGTRIGKNIQSCLFVDSLYMDDPGFKNSRFVTNFKKTFGKDPSVFEIQAYDAALLFKTILRSGVTTRQELRNRMAQAQKIQGALDTITVLPDRELYHPLVPLTVENGRVVKANQNLSQK